jgi:hypothetical protein
VHKLLAALTVLWLGGLLAAAGADTFALADGTKLVGDVVSFNENGAVFRTEGDKYTDRLPWNKFSQDTLKQLSQNPKIEPLVSPFIEPALPEPAAKPEIKLQNVQRLDRSAPPSLMGGLFTSPVGLVMLLLIYVANIFAGYEIAMFRARPVGLVTGVAALLPILGPIIFLSMPGLREVAAAQEAAAAAAAEAAPAEIEPHRFVVPSAPPAEEVNIVSGSWQDGAAPPPPPPSQAETEIFQRGQYMFNRRFFETKFAGFFGIVRREADRNSMLVMKTPRGLFTVERISRITSNDLHVEVLRGDSRQEVMVPFSEIQEVQLKHKDV